jgi:hypothetical protein
LSVCFLSGQLSNFDRKPHSTFGWLGGKYVPILPIWQTKNTLVQPNIHHAIDKMAGHGCNTVTLCAKGIFVAKLLP